MFNNKRVEMLEEAILLLIQEIKELKADTKTDRERLMDLGWTLGYETNITKKFWIKKFEKN